MKPNALGRIKPFQGASFKEAPIGRANISDERFAEPLPLQAAGSEVYLLARGSGMV